MYRQQLFLAKAIKSMAQFIEYLRDSGADCEGFDNIMERLRVHKEKENGLLSHREFSTVVLMLIKDEIGYGHPHARDIRQVACAIDDVQLAVAYGVADEATVWDDDDDGNPSGASKLALAVWGTQEELCLRFQEMEVFLNIRGDIARSPANLLGYYFMLSNIAPLMGFAFRMEVYNHFQTDGWSGHTEYRVDFTITPRGVKSK